ncbi:hypothetical protein HPP92_020088 [Vanilla planifolia]|uniref:BHLH domain-containing protein n=1 Tax=Vanilla planifolia TaxID=51239 RepID=A0A835UJY2_VANPL|nr:hypothetical protein HPP92_027790 [Vanilla planifolia]KAG0465924.1 hypothetical protein HPP92_020088 [Vanilla planifolia]
MDLTRRPCLGAGTSDSCTVEMTETLRFEEEIQSLMRENFIHHREMECSPRADATVNNSFTALLGLPPTQAVELLHEPELGPSASIVTSGAGFRFSVFASAEDAPEGCSAIPSNSPANYSPKLKSEPLDCDVPSLVEKPHRTAKRKEAEQSSKARSSAKKSKTAGGDNDCASPAKSCGDKLPYVHVRARRGQATDSHSLAERARREKINARMKLLQELVPGCSKISGTALVLDEIINHVQSLQRRVEFLSMRLATVNPRIDFSGFDNLLSAECGTAEGSEPCWMDDRPDAVLRRNHLHEQQKLIYHVDLLQSQQQQHEETPAWERDDTKQQLQVFLSSSSSCSPRGTSLFGYDSVASELPLSNKLKSEL